MKLVILLCMITAIAARSSTTTTEKNRTLIGRQNSEDFSPLTLCQGWSSLLRLAILVFAAIYGININSYFIASFFIAKQVSKIGNVFLAFVGVADLIINGGVITASTVALISDKTLDTTEACHVVQTLVATSTYSYSIFYSLVALVSWWRVNQARKPWRKYLPAIVATICFMVFFVGIWLAYVGTYQAMDYDYCQRKHRGDDYFRLATGSVHVFTCGFTVIVLISSYLKLKRRNKGNGNYRRSYQYKRDISLLKLNLSGYLLYVSFWVPYLVIVNFYPNVPDWLFYESAALGISRSLLTSTIYGFCNNIFGKTYYTLFQYCVCKISINHFRSRQARRGNGNLTRRLGEVRTHILMQPTVNLIGPQQDL